MKTNYEAIRRVKKACREFLMMLTGMVLAGGMMAGMGLVLTGDAVAGVAISLISAFLTLVAMQFIKP